MNEVQIPLAQRSIATPHPTGDPKAMDALSKKFESGFVAEMMGQMFQDMPTDGPFGGGQGEEMFRSLLTDEYGKAIETRGGFGLSDAISRQLLSHQEVKA